MLLIRGSAGFKSSTVGLQDLTVAFSEDVGVPHFSETLIDLQDHGT